MNTGGVKGYIRERITHRAFVAVALIYAAACLGSAVYWIAVGQVRNLCMSLAFIAFVPVICFVEYIGKIRLGAVSMAAVLFIAFGSILGSCFDVYMTIPFFDTLLHGLSGVVFACFGFTFAERFFGHPDTAGRFWGCVIFAVCFSLSVAVVWELFEYACTVFFGFDMMEDTYVHSIRSYLLAGSHTETVVIDGITKTVIYYGNGQTYTMNGYLDIGLIDTLTDLIICTVGAAVFALLSILGRKCPKLWQRLVPQVVAQSERS